MPDRAVVDVMCPNCESLEECGQGFPTPSCKMCDGTGCLNAKPQPRATSALSEDGQWLVTLNTRHDDSVWELRFLDEFTDSYRMAWPQGEPYIEDTGQDAHAVLADFLEGRG